MAGIYENLGVIKDGKLTPEGKKAIINRIRKMQREGGEKGSLFPCSIGKNLPPAPPGSELPPDIEDEKKYPEFHSVIIKAYEGVINALNLQGNFALPPPFIDPIAIAEKLGKFKDPNFKLDFDYAQMPLLNPATLAAKLKIDPIDFAKKLALPPTDPDAIIKPPPLPTDIKLPAYLPDPNYLADLRTISSPVPAPGFDVAYSGRIDFELWKSPQLGLPVAFAGIIQKLIESPDNIFKLISPNPEPCFAIEAIQESGIFGKADAGESSKAAIIQDLVTYTAESTIVTSVGSLIGDGGKNGITGKLAKTFNLFEEPPQPVEMVEAIPSYEDYVKWRKPTRPVDSILLVPFLRNTTPTFRQKLINIAYDLNLDPDWLALIMSRESGFWAAATNIQNGKVFAVGLIQWTTPPGGLKNLEELKKISAEKQLDYVRQYYGNNSLNFGYPDVQPQPERSYVIKPSPEDRPFRTMGESYVLTFYPKFLLEPDKTFDKNSAEYKQNKLFDLTGGPSGGPDGIISLEEVKVYVESQYVHHLTGREYPQNENKDTLINFIKSLPKSQEEVPLDIVGPQKRMTVSGEVIEVNWQDHIKEYYS